MDCFVAALLAMTAVRHERASRDANAPELLP